MHSSQNEQDSRHFADFARIPCLEPATQQEAYDMTREAFDLSERFAVPVMLRLVTRLAHSRTAVTVDDPRDPNALRRAPNRNSWILLPANARRQWNELLARQEAIVQWSEGSPLNRLTLNPARRDFGVITAGIGRNYLRENLHDLGWEPSHLHIGAYPMPIDMIRKFVDHVGEVLIFEDGYPFVERLLRGIVPPAIAIRGKMTGEVAPDGELSQDVVRAALGFDIARGVEIDFELPNRPPRLCEGCPHIDTYHALNKALEGAASKLVTSDIGCYTLGALPPHSTGDSCVCMGASVSMAKGASDAGVHPVVALIGDSTFLHSGVTPLMDAVASNSNMLLVILDNQIVAMTGMQPTLLPSEKLQQLVLGLGVDPAHCHRFEVHPRKIEQLTELMRQEIDYSGLSVIIAHRECIEATRKKK
jgi:indolepyruvate ferredoxin oxidoreductase alpha subunit